MIYFYRFFCVCVFHLRNLLSYITLAGFANFPRTGECKRTCVRWNAISLFRRIPTFRARTLSIFMRTNLPSPASWGFCDKTDTTCSLQPFTSYLIGRVRRFPMKHPKSSICFELSAVSPVKQGCQIFLTENSQCSEWSQNER